MLVDNAHTPNKETEDTYSDISGNECADGDYSAQAVSGLTWAKTGARAFNLDHSQISYGSSVTIAARYCYFVRRAGGSLVAGDLILGYYDLNDGGAANVSSTSSDFAVDANASGCFTETITPA